MNDQSPHNDEIIHAPGVISPPVQDAPRTQASPLDTVDPGEEGGVTEYLLVTDKTHEVLLSGSGPAGLSECRRLAGVVRRAGGEVTIFKSLKF